MDTYAGWPEFESGSYFISSSQPCFPSCPIKAKTLKNKQSYNSRTELFISCYLKIFCNFILTGLIELLPNQHLCTLFASFSISVSVVEVIVMEMRVMWPLSYSYVKKAQALDCERSICITSLNCGIIFSEIVMHRVTVLYLIKMISAFD